ncbi:hypothetical protein POTOM_002282 [Populus tomentosa]|uniref:Glycoside hydrolase family 3 C-terminal domain-containing protein n=1 Tax=Populus tomentosa TaxID=118781 RepID=A0A8X8DJI8_POPTO|nr:hypothetical protein POTOM_002282 [Populus tomentosa]
MEEGHVSNVMCSYNRVNGIPTCADPDLLKGVIREQWNLDEIKYATTPEDAVTLALKVGPNGNATMAMISIYAGIPSEYITPLQGLQKHISFVTYTIGCPFVNCTNELLDGLATKAATTADVVVLVMGLGQSIEQKDLDRENLILPGYQEKLVKDMANATNGTMILVIMSITGRSPFTWYPKEYSDQVPMTNINLRVNATDNFPGRTYRFYIGKPLYEFGHGLSYLTFSKFVIYAPSTLLVPMKSSLNPSGFPSIYPSKQDPYPNGQAIDVSSVNCTNLQLVLVIGVRNNRPMNGDHVVLIF